MIKIFGQTDRVFTSNGDVVLRPLKAKVHKEDGGDYYLEFEADLTYVDYLVEGNIIVIDTPQGEQPFRISNVTKKKSKLSTQAWHVFYDSENHLIEDSYVYEKNGNYALAHLNASAMPISPFVTYSDVQNIQSYRCVRKSLYEAYMTVLDRWGGHLVRDGFKVSLLQNIGVDNGVVVQYRKNLKDITCEEDWKDVVTQLLPVGKDGTLLNAVDSSASLYVTSEKQYALPYTKAVSFSQDIEKDDYDTEEEYKQALVDDLRQQAQEYVDEHCIPVVNYTLKANLEKLTDIGDVVRVIDERLGVDLTTQVIAFEYDCILEKYTQVEFGNFTPSLSGLVSNITAGVDKAVDEQIQTVQSSVTEQTGEIWSTLENSYVVFDGTQILVVDTLPKESATKCLKVDSTGVSMSETGINGTFRVICNLDGEVNLNHLDFTGIMALGGMSNTRGEIKLYNGDSEEIGVIDSDGIRVHGVDIYGKAGESTAMSSVVVGGLLTDERETLKFAVPVPKYTANTAVTVTALKISAWNTAGESLFGSGTYPNGYDILANPEMVLSAVVDANLLKLSITYPSKYFGVNNTPVGVLVNSIEFKY